MRDFEAGLIAEYFGDRRIFGRRHATIGVERRTIEEQLACVELHFHVGEFPLQALELSERASELLALQRPLACGFVAVAPERERARVADALDVETRDLLLEAAFLQRSPAARRRCRTTSSPILRR